MKTKGKGEKSIYRKKIEKDERKSVTSIVLNIITFKVSVNYLKRLVFSIYSAKIKSTHIIIPHILYFFKIQ